MHAIAHWRLENGERMKVLDQLLGSTGLFSTIITQLKFRNMGFVGIALIVLWALSPIGGQASLRVLDFGTITRTQPRAIYTLDRNSTMTPGRPTLLGMDATESVNIAKSIFTSSLTSTKDIQRSSMDNWGNLKIPMLERLTSGQNSEGWYDLAKSTNITYTSLIGVPVSTLSADKNTSFNMESWYWTLDCPNIFHPTGKTSNGTKIDFRLPGENSTSSKSSDGWTIASDYSWAMTSPLEMHTNEYDRNITQRPIYYRGFDDDTGRTSNVTRADCYFSTTYVEIAASCLGRNCSVTRMRPSQIPHPVPEFALGLDPANGASLQFFHGLVSGGDFQRPSPMQRFFIKPYAPFTSTNGTLDLYKLNPLDFAVSFAQLLNSWYQASVSVGQVMSGIPAIEEIPTENLQRNLSRVMQVYNAINATEAETIAVVKCQRAWLTALFIATGAMFLSGVFGLVLECTRKAPDFALNISSLTRDNPYIRLPSGGSTLDSIDRARLLRDVRVRFGDVRPDDPVGYLAIASCDRDGEVARLKGLERARAFE